MSHSPTCIENAATSIRENCAAQLTAPAWDAQAKAAEDAWVAMWAEEWVTDGTSTCICT